MNKFIKNIIDNYKENKLCYIALFVVFIVTSLSFFNFKSLQLGGFIAHDIGYHMMRIETLALEIKDGNIPFYNSAYRFLGYGALDFLYYPYAFLYIPSLLYVWTDDIYLSFNIFMILINLIAIISMYKSAKLIFNDTNIATIASIVFCMNYMFLWNMHLRIAVGESIAVAFMPMVIAGLYSIIFTDDKKSHYFIIGMTGMAQGHIITTVFFSLMIFAVLILFLLHILKNKKTIISLIKSFVWIVLLNVGFYYPFLVTYFTEKNVVMPIAPDINGYQIYTNLWVAFGKIPFLEGLKSVELPFETIGRYSFLEFALLIATAVFFVLIYVMKKNDKYTKIGMFFMFITIIYIVLSFKSNKLAATNKFLAKYILVQQFSMRYLVRSIPFISLAIGYSFVKVGLLADKFAFVLIALFALSGRYMINYNLYDENFKLRKEQGINLEVILFNYNDYTIGYTLEDMGNHDKFKKMLNGNVNKSKNITIENEEKNKLTYKCDFKKTNAEEGFIEFPFNNFNNFMCVINGKKIDIAKEDKKLVYVNIANDLNEGHLEVYYKIPEMYLYTFYVSILSSIVFIITMIYRPIAQIYIKCKKYIIEKNI